MVVAQGGQQLGHAGMADLPEPGDQFRLCRRRDVWQQLRDHVQRGLYTEHNTINVRVCAMYWHFVDVVWLLMFLTIYVL